MPNIHHEENDLLLYYSPTSFFSQKVLMTLHEKGIKFKTQTVNLMSNQQYESWFLEINPLAEVPVLKDGVKIIPDSKRIIQYLEDNFSNGYQKLLPIDNSDKLAVIEIKDLIDSLPIGFITKGAPFHPNYLFEPKFPFLNANRTVIMDTQSKRGDFIRKAAISNPKMADILNKKADQQDSFYKDLKNAQLYEQAIEKVDEVLNKVEAILMETNKDGTKDFNFLFSTHFTMADISLTILLVRLDKLGLSHHFWNSGTLRPLLDTYYKTVQLRESFKLSIPQKNDLSKNSKTIWYLLTGFSFVFILSVYFFRKKK